MKKSFKYIIGLLVVTSALSCKKQLDINTNPNAPITGTVRTVLPQAIVATANNLSQFNTYGAQVVGYFANGGGVSGWGSIISYNYQNNDFTGLWSGTYDILTDVKYVIDESASDETLKEFSAAAKVLKAYNFQLLVDTYNDVPYTEANLGLANVQPKYDKATDIYKNLADLCDQAITTFKTVNSATPAFVAADPMYGGNAAKWAQLANTLKLKLVLKGKGKVTFTNTTFDTSVGFITEDAIVQPGYTKVDGKQNPAWNRWAYSASNAVVSSASQYAVTPYIMSFYNGTKISDPARANVVFKSGTTTAVNRLGYQLSDAGRGASPSSWFRGTNATTYDRIGILKGPDAGQPIMLASESYFLQAEANLNGTVTGDAKANYLSGIINSYKYLYTNNAGAVTAGKDPNADATTYQTANVGNRLVNYDLATTDAQKQEAIITQKYIAFNMVFGHEAWNEYRRTGYPSIQISGASASQTFVSTVSESTAADKLPTRILYPVTEYQYNASNIPDVNKYTSKIFWAK
jgi:hypothetical protein